MEAVLLIFDNRKWGDGMESRAKQPSVVGDAGKLDSWAIVGGLEQYFLVRLNLG
jgi:hypothetical protein